MINKKDTSLTAREAIRLLRKTDLALIGKNKTQPVILYKYGRWHMIGIGFVSDTRMKPRRGIVNVHFMSDSRARKTVSEWLPYSKLSPVNEINLDFQNELIEKVLPSAEDYRTLIEKGWVTVVIGFTTDTLMHLQTERDKIDLLIEAIDGQMREGKMGPFLHFELSYRVITIR